MQSISVCYLMSVASGEKSNAAAGSLLGPSVPLEPQTRCPAYVSHSTDISEKVNQIYPSHVYVVYVCAYTLPCRAIQIDVC